MKMFLSTFLLISFLTDSAETASIHPLVTEAVAIEGRHVPAIIRFKNDATKKVQREYSRLRKQNLDERLTPEQVNAYVTSLITATSETQKDVRVIVDTDPVCEPDTPNCFHHGHDYYQIWLTNEMSVRDFHKVLGQRIQSKFDSNLDMNVTEIILDPVGAHPDYSSHPYVENSDCDTASDERPPDCPSASDERPGCPHSSEEHPDCESGSEEPQECTSSFSEHPNCATGSGSRATKIKARWYHTMMSAQRMWDTYGRGNGSVVGIIDSGVAMKHNFITSRYRLWNGWFDATYAGILTPVDDDGHGTCVVSAIISLPETNGNAVGMAPDAQWIACRAWKFSPPRNEQNLYSHILRCMQFMACPTNAFGDAMDCALRPRVVNHGWTIPGSSEHLSYTDDLFAIYEDLDILLVQSAGHRGPTCETMPHSASHDYTLTVGSINEQRDISFISSRGPTKDGRSKPDVVAPGEKIKCFRTKKSNEGWWIKLESGVSLATAQVSGVAALLFSVVPTLTAVQAKYILKTSTGVEYFTFRKQKCSDDDHDFRNTYGKGIVNANSAICTALHGPFPGFNITGQLVPLPACPAVCVGRHPRVP